jgi:hypothetical protein
MLVTIEILISFNANNSIKRLLDYSLNDFDGAIETGLGSVLW